MHIGMELIAAMLHLLFLMMCRSKRQRERNLRSQVIAIPGSLRCLDRFPCRAIYHYHHLCGSRNCWEQGR